MCRSAAIAIRVAVRPVTVYGSHPAMMLLLTILLLVVSNDAISEQLTARPLQLIGGDRLLLQQADGSRRQVRLAGIITAPDNQRWGDKARRLLGTLVMGRSLTVETRPGGSAGWPLVMLYHGGANINLRLLQAGVARATAAGLNSTELIEFRNEESKARINRMGMWSASGTGPPPPGKGLRSPQQIRLSPRPTS